MRGKNPKSMTDIQLMNLAKRRIMLRDSFKWHCGVYITGAIILVAVYFVLNNFHCWSLWLALAWGVIVASHGLVVHIALSDTLRTIPDEYYRLKGYEMVAKKMNGGISSEEDN